MRQKVKHIYLMGGVFGNAVEPDYNFGQGIEFATTLFTLWPDDVPMTFSPGEVGDPVEYVPEQVISDISWTDVHPIKQVYLNYNCNTVQKMWDPMAVINAVEGDELFNFSPWVSSPSILMPQPLSWPTPLGITVIRSLAS